MDTKRLFFLMGSTGSRESGGARGLGRQLFSVLLGLGLGACAATNETTLSQLEQPGQVLDANAALHCPRGTVMAAGQTQGRLSAVWCEKPDGQRHGPYLEWWENHQKKSVGLYRDGLRQGLWTFFLMDGQRDSQIEYRNGEAVSSPAAASPPR